MALYYPMETSPDPHGQAALMLCEGLMLLLLELGIISKDDAMQTIGDVIDVKQMIAGDTESVVVSITSIGLLRGVSQSMSASPVAQAFDSKLARPTG